MTAIDSERNIHVGKEAVRMVSSVEPPQKTLKDFGIKTSSERLKALGVDPDVVLSIVKGLPSQGEQTYENLSAKLYIDRRAPEHIIFERKSTELSREEDIIEPSFEIVLVDDTAVGKPFSLSAFTEGFEHHRAEIEGRLHALTGDKETAQDLTQQTFIKSFRGLSGIEGTLHLKPWLHKIAGNVAMDHLRQRKNVRLESIDHIDKDEFIPADVKEAVIDTDMYAQPEASFLLQEREEEIKQKAHSVLQKLKPRERLVMVLFYYKQLSCEDIGEIMGVTRNAVKSLLLRARNRFRDKELYSE